MVSTVLQLVDDAVASSPGSVAVSGPGGALTYGDLSVRADRVAQRLHMVGVRPGDLVGLCVDRSAALVVAALAILRAGAAYVAIDPKYPDERVQWMLDDAKAGAVILDDGAAARFEDGGGRPSVVLAAVGTLRNESTSDRADPTTPRPRPTDLAYVVYTSGSTGWPKGVMVEHASLANLVQWHRTVFALSDEDRCTQIASPGFDAAVWEIWPALASGASIEVVPEELRRDPVGLRDWIVAQGITVTFLPTAIAEGVIGLSWPDGAALRYLLTGGDALTRRPPAGLGFAVVNNYGLSETAVVATSGVVVPEDEGLPSIGCPIAGVVAEVVDEHLRLVAPGIAGELMIGGAALARGYLNRAELTAERFLEGPQGRRYRTGDRVRERPDGELEFLGRLDDQLSIRGFRVEPGEVVGALNAHPAIGASAVVAIGSSSSDRQLVAYVVPSGAERPDPADVDGFLRRSLPEHLVPERFVWLDALPLTPHGKLDREALVARAVPTGHPRAAAGPRASVEAAVGSVVAELIEVDDIDMNENFFLLGGHSMLGAQLIVRLEEMFGVEVTLRHLFDHPTLGEIAAEVERQLATDEANSLVRR